MRLEQSAPRKLCSGALRRAEATTAKYVTSFKGPGTKYGCSREDLPSPVSDSSSRMKSKLMQLKLSLNKPTQASQLASVDQSAEVMQSVFSTRAHTCMHVEGFLGLGVLVLVARLAPATLVSKWVCCIIQKLDETIYISSPAGLIRTNGFRPKRHMVRPLAGRSCQQPTTVRALIRSRAVLL